MDMQLNKNSPDSLPLTTIDLKETWHRDPIKIVVMLFDKTLLHIGRARSSMTGWSDENYQTHILNAVSVIQSLQQTLALDQNNSIAGNLDDLYRYISRILVESVSEKNPESLNQATSLLLQIREALAVFVKKSPQMLQH